MFDAFVLAAGLGTRLRPLTDDLPKPLVPICGIPLLAWNLALCAQHGLKRVVVNAHWRHERLLPWVGLHEGALVELSVEWPEILGTGGGLKKVRDQLAPVTVVVNGDTLHDVDLTLLRARVPAGGAAMALRVAPHEARRYGIVGNDATGTIAKMSDIAWVEPVGVLEEDTHFSGIHALDRDLLGRVPDGYACILRSAYKEVLPDRKLVGVRHSGTWLDVGDPKGYLEANLAVLRGGLRLPLDPSSRARFSRLGGVDRGDLQGGVRIDGGAWVGHDAVVPRGTVLSETVIGRGARVAKDSRLRRCVAWDGAEVPPGDWADTVFFGGEPLVVSS